MNNLIPLFIIGFGLASIVLLIKAFKDDFLR